MSEKKPHSGDFRPGQSGNPGGKPSTAEVSRLARRYTVDALRALIEVVRLPASQHASAKRAAARDLIDIAYPGLGKGGISVEGNAVHLHLLAVQQIAAGGLCAPAGGAPSPHPESPESGQNGAQNAEIDAESWISTDSLLPEPDDTPPGEALPLWDVWKARRDMQKARDIELADENAARTDDSEPIRPDSETSQGDGT